MTQELPLNQRSYWASNSERQNAIHSSLEHLPTYERASFQVAYNERRCVHADNDPQRARLNRLVSKGTLVRPYPSVYAIAEVWSHDTRRAQTYQIVRTLARLHPDWAFWGPTAAIVHGLTISNQYLEALHLADFAYHRKCASHIVWHQSTGPAPQTVDGVRVTDFEQTVFDCMRYLRFPEALAVADSALRIRQAGPIWLTNTMAQVGKGHVNVRHALEVARHADGRAESGGESIARASIIELGFVVPDLQVSVPNPIDGGEKRVDFYWRLSGVPDVIGELDGREKYLPGASDKPGSQIATNYSLAQLSDERLRESRISVGARIMRFSYWQALDHPYLEKMLQAYSIPRDHDYRPLEFRKVIPEWAR